MPAPADEYPLVIRPGETEIFRVGYQPDVGKLPPDHFAASVAGVVVDDDDFKK